MRSIKRNFEKISVKRETQGAYLSLAQVVNKRNFSRKSIVKAFKELMPESDYSMSESKALIDYLDNISKASEGVEK